MCLANGVLQKGGKLVCPVDDTGCFTSEVTDFAGQYVKVRPGKEFETLPSFIFIFKSFLCILCCMLQFGVHVCVL